ncbi:thioredoxin fold domain-containing protein [Marinobacter sp.]|uniref:thioredoxin fold domain-containing protein n=1 Tax=Marinobacter sp. TaxID=50741 RepID=UPI00356B490F
MSLKASNVKAFLFGVVGAAALVALAFEIFFYGKQEVTKVGEKAELVANEDLEKAAFEKIRIVEPQLTLNQVRASDLYPGLVEVYNDGKLRYVLGDLVIRGDLIDIETGENLTQKTVSALRSLQGISGGGSANVADTAPVEQAPVRQQTSTPSQASEPAADAEQETGLRGQDAGSLNAALAILANDIIPDEMTVVYPAAGEEKHQVTIFSDVTCPVCKKNHEDYAEFQSQGVTIRAALFPRRGMDAAEAQVMSKVLCAPTMEERRTLLDRAYTGDPLEEAEMCDNGYLMNIRDIAIAQDSGLGVHSTPTLMSANGLRVDGYPRENPVPTIMRMLEERTK